MAYYNHITKRSNGLLLAVLIAIAMLLLVLAACSRSAPEETSSGMTKRQEVVATRGVAVMPFDLERTTHIFSKREDGGLQQVIADDPDDREQIALIRAHLAEEAERLQQGDFHDPAMIHGSGAQKKIETAENLFSGKAAQQEH